MNTETNTKKCACDDMKECACGNESDTCCGGSCCSTEEVKAQAE